MKNPTDHEKERKLREKERSVRRKTTAQNVRNRRSKVIDKKRARY